MKIDCHLHLPVREELTNYDAKKEYLLNELQTSTIDYGILIPDNVEESSIGNLHQCINLFEDDSCDSPLIFHQTVHPPSTTIFCPVM